MGSSFAYEEHEEGDAVHDYEHKAPLRDSDIHRMFRVQPKDTVIAKDYRPEDTIQLMDALRKGTTCIIPTYDINVTLKYMRFVGYDVQLNVSQAEDEGWFRLMADSKEGKLAKDIIV